MPKTVNAQTGLWNSANNTKQVIVIHDTESGSAGGALSWMQSQRNGSYQDLVDLNGDVYLMVPEDKQAWAAMGTGNRIGLHVCATGYASWSRAKWLSYPALLASVAATLADWSRKYGIPLVRLSAADVRAGKRGVCGHGDISKAFRESDHTDPGGQFPFDVVLDIAGSLDAKAITAFKAAFMGPVRSDVRDIESQLTVAWPQLGGRTLTDGIAAVLTAIEKGAHV